MGRTIQSERIRFYRKNSGFTQREVAERLGVDLKTYTNWENSRVDLTRDKIEKVASVLGIEFEKIWNELEFQRRVVPEEQKYKPAEVREGDIEYNSVSKLLEELNYLKEQNRTLTRALTWQGYAGYDLAGAEYDGFFDPSSRRMTFYMSTSLDGETVVFEFKATRQ